jgi:hypothetical protein
MSAHIAEKPSSNPAGRDSASFVLNLCASTSPMALTHPTSPELKRYTFFVSRQREDGRERFRLHMGYFASQAAAELMLPAVREVYPAAWAGPAPTSSGPRRQRPLAPTIAISTAPVEPAAIPVPVSRPVVQDKPAAAPKPAVSAVAGAELASMSNVRDVLAQLSEAPVAAKPAARPVPPRALRKGGGRRGGPPRPRPARAP